MRRVHQRAEVALDDGHNESSHHLAVGIQRLTSTWKQRGEISITVDNIDQGGLLPDIDKRLYKQDICHSGPEVQSKNINVTKIGPEFLVFYF